jgi:LacI family transcriptional regulator
MDRLPLKIRVDSVLVGNVKGALMCLRHLTDLNHQLIAMITGPLELQTSRERVKGYKLGLAEAELPFQEQLFRVGDFRFDSGYRLAKDLCLGYPRPTAIFVANGTMGLGAVKAIQELGLRCPEEIAIAIFDDVPGGDVLRPRLTVVSQPAYALGFKATELLLNRISCQNQDKKPIAVTLEPELIIRESTAGLR